uniref:Uncharacterized protein n=1 Tax=Nelumbo nucifera TaxID=4432 RepID=A0A822YJI0_NELNU|nr:TPA_asm: hypothetical protein HUJ06_011581 [Nelumbo nucifera]
MCSLGMGLSTWVRSSYKIGIGPHFPSLYIWSLQHPGHRLGS